MCGIFGINKELDKDSIIDVKKSLKHRGPDQDGVTVGHGVTLIHTRLSILDVTENGLQPMFTPDKKMGIVFNGEVYNFAALKKELETDKVTFTTKTDTEVILKGYIKWGVELFKKMEGMWALCIYDFEKQEFILSRDVFGKKPLYIYDDGANFCFASELNPIINLFKKNLTIDEDALTHYFAFCSVPRNASIFKQVYKLTPASYCIKNLKTGRVESSHFYKVNFSQPNSPTVRDFDRALDASVVKRLIADVPVGAFLSGGVDSSGLVAYASKYKKNLRTFSISMRERDFDESKYQQIVATKYKTVHTNVLIDHNDVQEIIKKMPTVYGEPFADSSQIATMLVSKVAGQHVKCCLSGDGADELFGGYERYYAFRIIDLQKYVPAILRKILNKLLGLLHKATTRPVIKQLQKFLDYEYGGFSHVRYMKLLSNTDNETFVKLTGREFPVKIYEEYFKKHRFPVNVQLTDIENYLLEDILVKVDRASMAYGLEVRNPYLTRELLEIGLGIPPRQKFGLYSGKKFMKKHFEQYLPKDLLYRKKMGFSIPLKHYFRSELKPLVEQYVLNYHKHHYLDADVVKKLCNAHFEGTEDNTYIIWTMLMFNMWHEEFTNGRLGQITQST